jgi:S1-C subfamily serine protease
LIQGTRLQRSIVFSSACHVSFPYPGNTGMIRNTGGSRLAGEFGRWAIAVVTLLAVAHHGFAETKDVQKLAERVGKGVVTIKTADGSGSGFIIDGETVATNFHVIAGATKASVVFHDKSQVEVVGFCAVSPETDIAILTVKVPADKVLHALPIAAELPQPGEAVYAFGSPLSLSGSISDGIVSAVRRGKEIEAASALGYKADSTWIQTTAPISQGNSGGPIVNAGGEVLGLATFYDKRGQNINFATSARQIATMVEAFRFLGRTEKKLSELPKPVAAMTAKSADPNATLEFWNNWAKMRTKARVTTKTPPKARDARIALHERTARGFQDFAAAVGNLTTKGVDSGLLEVVASDAAIHRRLGEAWSKSATALKNNDLRGQATLSREIDQLNRQLAESDSALTSVRFALSKAHGIDYPGYMQSEDKQAKSGDGKESGKESDAARDLKRAKLLLKGSNKDAGKKGLQKVKEHYPNTPEAEEAETLLKSL